MGVRACEKGVTLRFLDKDGSSETRNPVTGEFAYFFSKRRLESPNSSDPIYGSQDWLTDVIVVDNPIKLTTMQPSQTNIDYTSCSSKRVLVQWSVGAETGHSDQCFTISTGHQETPSGYLYADTVLVLPPETQMNSSHSLWSLWKDMAIKFFGPNVSRLFEGFRTT